MNIVGQGECCMAISDEINNLYNELDALRLMLIEVSDAFAELVKCGGGGDASSDLILQYQQLFNDKIKAVKDSIMSKQQQLRDLTEQVVSIASDEEAARSTDPKDFLVVDDREKPTTWHLQVKRNGKPDHNLMGAAWAALHSGFRGNKYEGPNKQEALKKLKALYKSEGLPLPSES